MQELLQNKFVIGLIVLAAIGLIYTFATGGFSGGGGDLPQFEGGDVGTTATSAPPPTTTPAGETSGTSTTPPPTGSTTAPAAPVTTTSGVGTSTGEPQQPSTPVPGETAPSSTKPSSVAADTGINEKLQAFRNLYPDDIIKNKYEVLEEEVTKPENFAEDIGRVDPLTVVNDFIPEELRPPREGETSDEEMWKFIGEAVGYEILDSISIEVVEVVQVGNYRSVVCYINGQIYNMQEGEARGANGITIQATKVTRAEVVFTLFFTSPYASVSKTKSFISGSY